MRFPVLTNQIMRFLTIGVMNTGVDFIILNLLIATFGLGKDDPRFIIFKIISFTLAAVNSFMWNRGWVFRREAEEKSNIFVEIVEFFGVSALSFLLNIGVAATVYHGGGILFPEIPSILLANAGAIIGSAVAFSSNFFGYKFFVFKK